LGEALPRRSSAHFDAVIDFDLALCDPADPLYLVEKYDSGDFLPFPRRAHGDGKAFIHLALFSS